MEIIKLQRKAGAGLLSNGQLWFTLGEGKDFLFEKNIVCSRMLSIYCFLS